MSQSRRSGVALVLVLLVTTLLSLAAYTFAELMFAEYRAADAHGRGLQARVFCESGAEKALFLLALDGETLRDRGGLYDNPADLQGIVVVDGVNPADRGRFTVIAPKYEPEAPTTLRYGLEDESAKLNLNVLIAQHEEPAEQKARLMALPGMTEEVADSILDWLDEDDEPRELGAEADFYAGLAPPYAPTNGPLRTIEELLLVQGVTPELLFGPDANRNGFVDPHEAGAPMPEGIDNADGSFDRGWSGYLSIYGAEPNRNSAGAPRINLNGDDLEQIFTELSASEDYAPIAAFIVAYRQGGPYTGSTAPSPKPAPPPDFEKQARYKFASVLDLVGAKTSSTVNGETQVMASPFAGDPLILSSMLPKLLDGLTTQTETVIRGRVNINQAARQVLLGVPGLDEEKVDQILSLRYSEPTEELPGSEYPTWLLTSSVVTLDEMKALMPYVTCRGGVYRGQIVGYFEDGPAARAEVVFDTTSDTPRQLFWRDIGHLGRGFATATLGAGGP
jgi:hypothetical protein